jgi:hypothetical protein
MWNSNQRREMKNCGPLGRMHDQVSAAHPKRTKSVSSTGRKYVVRGAHNTRCAHPLVAMQDWVGVPRTLEARPAGAASHAMTRAAPTRDPLRGSSAAWLPHEVIGSEHRHVSVPQGAGAASLQTRPTKSSFVDIAPQIQSVGGPKLVGLPKPADKRWTRKTLITLASLKRERGSAVRGTRGTPTQSLTVTRGCVRRAHSPACTRFSFVPRWGGRVKDRNGEPERGEWIEADKNSSRRR